MKTLLVSKSGDGVWFAKLLQSEGNDSDWAIHDEAYAGILEGIVDPPLSHAKPFSDYDLILFDMSGLGKLADQARQETPTLGGSEFADRLENDRIVGIEFMEACGIRVPPWSAFDDPADALRWVRTTRKRCVFKPCGDSDCEATYVSKNHEDMERYLDLLFRRTKVKQFVLQEYVKGTEVSTEGWLAGGEWCAINHTLEVKKLLAGDLGPNTGCAGSVVWMPPRETALFKRGLGKAREKLAEAGYAGSIDLNTISTEGEAYGIEWTPRFGYDATAQLTRLLPMPFGEFAYRVATGEVPTLASARNNFAASLRLSVPPYPSRPRNGDASGIPIDGIDESKLKAWYLNDVRMGEHGMETAGTSGFIGCPLGLGETIGAAFEECKTAIDRLMVPNLQWRVDVPERVNERYEMLVRQGWLKSI